MRKVVPKEGPCAPLFFSALALLLLTNPANAQTVEIGTLEVCAALETEALKLACFEAIISKGNTTVSEGQPAEVVRSAPAGIPETPDVNQMPTIIEATSQTAAVMTVPPFSTASSAGNSVATDKPPAAIEAMPRNAKTALATDVVPIAPERRVADDLGREHLDQVEQKTVIKATVVDVTQGYNKDLRFHLANGQVWRQIEARHLQYPKNRDFEIEITKGMLGAYRMRIGENGRLVKIRRTQ